MEQNSEIIIYTDSDGTTKLQVQLEDETVWLTQDQMAMLFGKAKSTINEHIKNIYTEGELEESQTLKKFGISEFQQKVTDIYATSIDYKNDATLTKEFFATVQNKMHYAIHGQTAAEMISQRVDAEKPFLGLTSFQGKYITTRDISIAKNYLSEDELKQLNLIVSMYLILTVR